MDQNTALIVALASNSATVMGTGGVNIFDIGAAAVDPAAKFFTVANVRYSYATPGDTIDLQTGAVTIAAWKTPLRGREGALPAPASADVFNSPDNPAQPAPATKQFIVAAQQLFNATGARSVSTTWETVPVQVPCTVTIESPTF